MPSFPSSSRFPIATPGKHPGRMEVFSPPFRKGTRNFSISGVTRDSAGAALGNVTVDLFRTGDNSFVTRTISDGSGNYSFTLPDNAGNFFLREYLAGAPDRSGTSVNTLVAV